VELGILRVVGILGFLFRVEVVEVPEEFVEAVNGRQIFIPVAQVVLANLRGGVALWLQQFGNGRILVLDALFGAGQADFQQAGAKRRLT
jgi:hypothetical protein